MINTPKWKECKKLLKQHVLATACAEDDNVKKIELELEADKTIYKIINDIDSQLWSGQKTVKINSGVVDSASYKRWDVIRNKLAKHYRSKGFDIPVINLHDDDGVRHAYYYKSEGFDVPVADEYGIIITTDKITWFDKLRINIEDMLRPEPMAM